MECGFQVIFRLKKRLTKKFHRKAKIDISLSVSPYNAVAMKKWVCGSVLACLTGLSSTIWATPSGFGWTPATTPLYYACTNNSVNYSARAGSQERLTSIILFIGGTQVKSVTADNSVQQVKTGVISAVFDSSHFADGTGVETHIDVNYDKLIGGVWVAQTIAQNLGSATINVINKTSIYTPNNPPFDILDTVTSRTIGADIAVEANTPLVAMNYASGTLKYDNFWSNTNFYASTIPTDIVIMSTHGAATYAMMQSSIPTYPLDVYVDGIHSNKSANPSQPPVSLFWMLACKQGSYIDWADAMLPGYPGQIDQCVVGFNLFISLVVPVAMPQQTFAFMSNGWTVAKALSFTIDPDQDQTNQNILMVSTTVGANGFASTTGIRPMDAGDVVLMGDPCMKIKGVYTGDHTVNANWYR